ncbi:MAG: phenylacetic acid degradation protein [Micrococcales bacterium]|nr:MAG: phenylacetic acid degradation protein [Micrococcales bacterium]
MGLHHPLLVDDFASHWLGLEVLRAVPGEALLRMQLREEMLNGFGIAHGGMIFALADTAFALACNDAHRVGIDMTVASGADINFLRPAHRGQSLTAHAQVVRKGRSGLIDITVSAQGPDDPEPYVCAEIRGRSRTIPYPQAPAPGP